MQPSMTFSSRLPPVLHLHKPAEPALPKNSSSNNVSVQALDSMLDNIVSSVGPTEKTSFIEAVAKASSHRRGHEHLMIEHLIAHSPSFGSGSGSTEPLPRSPLSVTQNELPGPGRSDTLTLPQLHRRTPPKENTCQKIPDFDKLTHHLLVPNDGSDVSAPRPRRQITVKHYSDATPSMHCHICCRSSKNIKVYSCARIKEAICRKVVCSRCFIENNWVYKEGWQCSHCRGICPARSQCFTYGRSNLRRKLQASKKKHEKSQKSETRIHTLSSKLISKKYVSNPRRNFMPQIPQISLAEAIGIRSEEPRDRAICQ